MPGATDPEGLISKDELAHLAGLFDAFQHPIEVFTTEAKQAEAEFNEMVLDLHENRVALKFPGLDHARFKTMVRIECRRFLKKNPPSTP